MNAKSGLQTNDLFRELHNSFTVLGSVAVIAKLVISTLLELLDHLLEDIDRRLFESSSILTLLDR